MTARILVIEDNPANLELMSYLLKAFGLEPAVARDGEEGLEAAARTRPDLVLCDVQLPGIDGIEVVRRLKRDADLAGVPVVAVTALAMVGDRDRLLAAGFDGYIGKPIDPQSFVAQVESFLGVRVPSRPTPRVSPDAGQSPRPSPARGTVLIVDNAAVNRELLSSLLEPVGFEVVAASSAAEAAECLREAVPDLIVCDVHMPAGDGFEVLQGVRSDSRLRRVPFILISATVWEDADRRRGFELGADRFVLRPIEARALLAEIEGLLAGRAQGNANDALGAASAPPAAEPAPDRRARVLIVDDSPTSRDLTEMILEHYGYEVAAAGNAEEACAAAGASPPDLILSDMNMPGEDGIELLRRLKAEPRLAAIPVILMSASSFSDADARRARALGADQCVERPVEAESLLQLVEGALRKLRRQAERHGEDPDR